MHGGGHARHVVASEVFLFTTNIYIDIRKLQQTSLKSPRKKTKLYKSWDDRRTRRNNSWRRGRRSRQRMVAEVSRTHCLVRFDSRFQVPVVYTMRGVCVPYRNLDVFLWRKRKFERTGDNSFELTDTTKGLEDVWTWQGGLRVHGFRFLFLSVYTSRPKVLQWNLNIF